MSRFRFDSGQGLQLARQGGGFVADMLLSLVELVDSLPPWRVRIPVDALILPIGIGAQLWFRRWQRSKR